MCKRDTVWILEQRCIGGIMRCIIEVGLKMTSCAGESNPLIFSQAHVWGICGRTRCITSGKAVRIQRSTKSHSTLGAFWKQSDLSCGGCSRPSRPREPLPAHDETHDHGQCDCERKASPTACFPLGGIFLQAVSGFSLVRKCLCFSPHCFSLMDWRARDRLWRSKGHRMALLCLSLAVLTAGPSLTVPQEEMQIYS